VKEMKEMCAGIETKALNSLNEVLKQVEDNIR